MRDIVFRPEAAQEYDESCEFYGSRDREVCARFQALVEQKLQSLVKNHELYPIVQRDIREATLRSFPFTIYVRVTDQAIRVLSVFHHRRDPSVWQSRAEDS